MPDTSILVLGKIYSSRYEKVRNNILSITVCIKVLFIIAPVQADILFIDFNYSPQEVKTASEAAAARHEKLIVFPEIKSLEAMRDLSEVKRLEESKLAIINQVKNVDKQISNSQRPGHEITGSYMRLESGRAELNDKLNDINREISNLTKRFSSTISEKSLSNFLNSEPISKSNIETIVISGHHTNGYFGNLGSLKVDDIQQVFDESPALKKSVLSILGWGCYSATAAQADFWRRNLPNLRLLAGFEESAPSGLNGASPAVLGKLLEKEGRLSYQNTSTTASYDTLIKSFIGMNKTSFAGCTPVQCTDDKNQTKKLDSILNECGGSILDLLSTEANDNQFSVYCNTQHSPLRQYYSNSRRYEHCVQSPDSMFLYFDPETLIRQIFFQSVKANFDIYYASQFKKLQNELSVCSDKNDMAYIKKLSDDLTKKISCIPEGESATSFVDSDPSHIALGTYFSTVARIASESKCSLSEGSAQLLKLMQNNFTSINGHTHLSHTCLPDDWIEPASSRSELSAVLPSCEVP